jgi:hypothetical protein
MPTDINTQTTRAMYLLASDRLRFLTDFSGEGSTAAHMIADAICSMGSSDHLSDYKTDEELIGAMRFMNWIIDTVQYSRSATEEARHDPGLPTEAGVTDYLILRKYPIKALEDTHNITAASDDELLHKLEEIAHQKRSGGRFKPIGNLRLDKMTDQINVYFRRGKKDILFCTLMVA